MHFFSLKFVFVTGLICHLSPLTGALHFRNVFYNRSVSLKVQVDVLKIPEICEYANCFGIICSPLYRECGTKNRFLQRTLV